MNRLELRKQYYTIDEGGPGTDELSTQKKIRSNQPAEHNKARSHELFDNRKKTILEAVASYLAILPHIRAEQFSKNGRKYARRMPEDSQIAAGSIQSNPFIPGAVKEILDPITSELKQAGMSLNRQQFLWAIQKLFEELPPPGKGTLLGWGIRLLPPSL